MKTSPIQFVPVKTAGQIALCARLASSIWRECYADILVPGQIDYMVANIQSVEPITRQIQSEDYAYFLLADGDKFAGYVAVQPEDEKLLLSKLYIESRCRGRGLGGTALRFVEQTARERACKSVWLTVNRFNERAIAVYKKAGYQVIREQQADIGGGFVMDDFVLEKPM